MTIEEAVAKNLRKYLDKNNMTIRTLAKLSGVHVSTIGDYLKAQCGASVVKLYYITKVLDIKIDDLLEGCTE